MKSDFDVVIIGAGVAGMTAAIYLKRSGINCCLLEREVPGGQINKSSSVKNYPGFLDISGPDLSNNIFEQIRELEVPYKYGNVLKIEVSDGQKIVKTDLEEITTQNIIIATGRKSRKLDVPGEDKLLGKGVSYCALCDANFFKDEDVLVIGGANSALEEAIYLSNICRSVTIIHRRDTLTADEVFIEQIKQIKNITIRYNCLPKKLNEKEGRLESVTIENEQQQDEEIKVKGCFIYIGQVPANEIFKDILNFDDKGYIEVDKHQQTNIKGIYAAGDVVKKDAYQLLTAMSDGVIAAVNCIVDIKKGA
ncbi:MAG: FAD-dependent oxidoreductase [Bacilli bacterium]|nr:FAD-dependent oxidoreductase [Bacilli bacterium]